MICKPSAVLIALSLSVVLSSTCGAHAATSPTDAARGVLGRLLPGQQEHFVFEQIPTAGGRDVFEIESRDGKIVLRGSSGVSMCSGLNWYLKYHCRCHVSFCGDQLALPDPLPAVKDKIRRESPFEYRYMFNFCAFSYTLAWWDWQQWERMIDWMALHGVNMPLSVTGQEAIWYRVYRDLGLSDEQIRGFFVGPGYLPFGWMGCMDGWGGPLPKSWIDSHLQLQKKIVARQRELGMTPVLQGFTGHVPPAIKEKFPDAKLQRLPNWIDFPGTHFIDPADPLFKRIGKAFIEEQTRQFGTDHLYASDTFIEMAPPSNDPAFLDAMGKAVYAAMEAGDPEARWVMQGWLFYYHRHFWKPPQVKALLGSVANERMILLDLFSEAYPVWDKTEAFGGKPWIFCAIHNFGGKVSLYGGLPQITGNLSAALKSPDRGKLSGVGIIMEGFGYNPIVYELLTEMAWRDEVPDLDGWLPEFVHGRYGRRIAKAEAAWQSLRESVYRRPHYHGSVIFSRPSLSDKSGIGKAVLAFDREVLSAWKNLLDCAGELGRVDTYRFDLVHVTRHMLADLANYEHARMLVAYRSGDRRVFAEASKRYLDLLSDVDRLLATREEFLLGRWLEDAKGWATNEEEKRLYEFNARNIITLWGPRDSRLHEYAQRQWSGLIEGFYRQRWQQFIGRLDESLVQERPFDNGAFQTEIQAWEEKWAHGSESYATEPAGDPIATCRALWTKYGPAFEK